MKSNKLYGILNRAYNRRMLIKNTFTRREFDPGFVDER